ncbi:MAG: hypothetical protein OEY29_16210, partial [Gammaproteobacteria bacterium]|nr:hypothetical protein [Gammaproteobacteria bacterium]
MRTGFIVKGHSTKLSIIFTLLLFSVTACDLFDNNSRPSFPVPVSCHNDDYNQYVYDVMKRFYYWYDEVDPFSQIDPKDTIAYPDAQSLLDVLKFYSLDRF